MNKANPKVDWYFKEAGPWQKASVALRAILLDSPLTEELKWGKPTYTLEGANVVLLHGFKNYCALLFTKGVLLKDPNKILVQQTPNVQSARQIRFTTVGEIVKMKPTLQGYLAEAIAVEKAGLKVDFVKSTALVFPEEFQSKLDAQPALKSAFEGLTPGRQRAYHLYFGGAKQAKTRAARVEKCIESILAGKGLDDD